jgi:hypothetical protein
MQEQENREFECGVFRLACPYCGSKQLYAYYDVGKEFLCRCGGNLLLQYRYLDRLYRIVYGLYLERVG